MRHDEQVGWKRTIREQLVRNPTWLKPAKNSWNIGITFPMPEDPERLEERVAFTRSLLEPAGWRFIGCAEHSSIPGLADARFERGPAGAPS